AAEAVLRIWRAGSAGGGLPHHPSPGRADHAWRARRVADLAGLLRALPRDHGTGPARAASRWSRFAGRLRVMGFRAAWPAPRLPRLVLPRGPRTVFTIGRSPDCDLPLGDITVSWHHA